MKFYEKIMVEEYISEAKDKRILQTILKNPKMKKELMIKTIMATQHREGIMTTYAQAKAAYEKVQKELSVISESRG